MFRQSRIFPISLSVVLLFFLASACSPYLQPPAGRYSSTTKTSNPVTVPVTGNTAVPVQPPTGPNLTEGVSAVADHVKPAIVQITNMQVQLDELNQPYTVPAGTGSGVIYDPKGYVLTNNHVIAGAQELLVSLPDGRTFPGKLLGADPMTDLAVVQINGSSLPIAQLGDSSQLKIGDWVIAIGYALGLPGGPTVSAGVLSANDRTVQEPGEEPGTQGPYLFDMLQTDAAINPGNSGGALVNLNGQVIGINTLVASGSPLGYQAQGIGFAISMATAKPIADQLATTGKAVHPYMGINYVTLTPSIAAQLSINQPTGALVTAIASGSPAEKSGLLQKDVITAVDDQPIVADADLAKILNTHKPGDTISLTVYRNNQKMTVKLTLAETPS